MTPSTWPRTTSSPHEVGRKAMILLTDGEDQGSKLKIKDAIEAASKSRCICYVLLIADRRVLRALAAITATTR